MFEKNTAYKKNCDVYDKIDAISIFDNEGNILVAYPPHNNEKELLMLMKLNFKTPSRKGEILSVKDNCHKFWFKRKDSLIFSLATNKDINEKVSKHIFDLITKPFLEGFKENIENYKIEKKNFEFFTEILASCCYQPFIKVLSEELING